VQEQGYTERQTDRSVEANRRRLEEGASSFGVRGRAFNPTKGGGGGGVRNWGTSRGW
jgi:hypothetical protein